MNKNNDNTTYKPQVGIVEKKLSKNKKIMIWSGLGLTALTVGVSLPFGFLTNFNSQPIIIEKPLPPSDKPYNEGIVLTDDQNNNFKAYYVDKWKNMFFTEININLTKGASNSVDEINLQNLANIGIVPTNDNWRNWQWVRSAPILNKANQFAIRIQTQIINSDTTGYVVMLKNGIEDAIKPSTSYNVDIDYLNDPSLIAYKPNSLKTISDSYLTYTKDSQDGKGITIENLERIGIVPIFDAYKTWNQITLFPIDATTIKVAIDTGNVKAIKTYNIPNLTPSTLYNSQTIVHSANDNSFVAYSPNLVKENFLVDLSLEYTKSNSNPDFLINYNNLAKIGIVPLSNGYKLWESIKLQPITSNEVKIIVSVSTSNKFEYTVSGVKKSTFYDGNTVIHTDTNFIMYLPNNWKNLYPLEGKLTLTNSSFDPNTKISLATLEKIGIVPITSDYLTWTSIDISPTKSATCTIVIKKNNNVDIVATIVANHFKTSGTYGTNILYTSPESTIANYNFIWYRPTAWNNTILANTININLTQPNITLASLEAIGIVPLSDSYKSWASIKNTTTELHGLQGLFNVTINHTTPGVNPLPTIEINDFKTSSIYDPLMVLETTTDYYRFLPIEFKSITQAIIESKYKTIDWFPTDITISNLEILGIVPLNENYRTWKRLFYKRTSSNTTPVQLVFAIQRATDTLEQSLEIPYPITMFVNLF